MGRGAWGYLLYLLTELVSTVYIARDTGGGRENDTSARDLTSRFLESFNPVRKRSHFQPQPFIVQCTHMRPLTTAPEKRRVPFSILEQVVQPENESRPLQ